VGIDARGSAPFRVIAAGAPGQPSTYYDFMSYCANTNESTAGGNKPDAWISIRNWQRALTFRRSPARATAGAGADVARIPASQPADAPTLRVQITAPLGEPPSIVNVAPDGGAPTPDQGNGYRLVTRDASGTLLATAGVVMEVQHDDGAPPSFDLTGRISAAGATAVQLVQGDRVVAGQLASPHAPVVRILAPRRGATIGGKAPVRIRWSATDQDHGSLVAIVEYSPDDGRSWRVVEVGPSHGEVRLPAALFPASRRARVRVRAQDGFHETVATSGRFVSLGAPPRVRIELPASGTSLLAGATFGLEGQAFDDGGRELQGRALTWRDGSRLLGHGEHVTGERHEPARRGDLRPRRAGVRRRRAGAAGQGAHVARRFAVARSRRARHRRGTRARQPPAHVGGPGLAWADVPRLGHDSRLAAAT